MSTPRFLVVNFTLGMMAASATAVLGQEYPSRPIRIVTSPAGGGSDFTARVLAQGLTGSLTQPIVVDNRAVIAAPEIVFKSPPDGYTLYLGGSTFMIGHLLQKRPYDPVRDFSPVSLLNTSPSVVVVHPSLPVRSVKDLIALAKARPKALNYGSAGELGSNRFTVELFKSMARVDIVWINYRGTGPALNATISGEVQLMITGAGSVAPHVKSGRLRALAVTSAQPSALVPGLPTVAASGVPGYEVVSLDVLFAPAKTPATIINLLNREIDRTLHRADIKQKFFDFGVEVVGGPPEDLANRLLFEIELWGKVIQDLGLHE